MVDLIYGNNNFTLTCLTSGAPATSVYGECVNKDCPHSQLEITVEPVTLLYRNTLILESQANTSHFVCVTRRAEITSYATFLTKFGKGRNNKLVLIPTKECL